MGNDSRFDRITEHLTRTVAQHSSRRSFLTRVASAIAGGAFAFPLLPVDRRVKKASAYQTEDPLACNYWRHCSLDGYVCGCCGGTMTECPPGTNPSPSSWVSSCENPDDGQAYLIAYRDCCGRNVCGRCACLTTVGELPAYRPELNNDSVWCFGAPELTYHCTVSPFVARRPGGGGGPTG